MSAVSILRVIVASPNDVKGERDGVEAVAAELNRTIGPDRNLRIEVSRWETDAFPGFDVDGPQGLIDPILKIADCDVLIGIFWKRFGTPALGSKSGTEHEFRVAYEAWKKFGRPQIMVYFNEKPFAPKTKAETDQWGQVLEFKHSFPENGLWWSYKGKAQFGELVRNHLTQFIRQRVPLASRLASNQVATSTSDSTDGSATQAATRPRLTPEQLAECLKALGVAAEPFPVAVAWAQNEINCAILGTDSGSDFHSLGELLTSEGQDASIAESASAFFDGYLDFLVPSRLLSRSFYISASKIGQMYRAYRLPRQQPSSSAPSSELSVEDKFFALQAHFCKANRIVHLPSLLLLGKDFPADPNLLMYFSGCFTLKLTEEFFLRFQSAKRILGVGQRDNLIGLASEVFQHPDPMVYALVQFEGSIAKQSASMTLSRKHIAMGSMVASGLGDALSGRAVGIGGLGTVQRASAGLELHPFVCTFSGYED
jgi:hypothetical protein